MSTTTRKSAKKPKPWNSRNPDKHYPGLTAPFNPSKENDE